MNKTSPIVAEFSRSIAVGRLEPGELTETIVARADERSALAARFGLVAIDGLKAEVTLRLIGRGPVVRVEGRLWGEVVQTCVVSLEPIRNRVEESFILTYAPARQVHPLQTYPLQAQPGGDPHGKGLGTPGHAGGAGGKAAPGRGRPAKSGPHDTGEDTYGIEIGPIDQDEEPPEPLIGGQIDIGEAVAQQLALGLDPYPRKPEVKLEDVVGDLKGVGGEGASAGRPFAALARLQRRKS